MNPKHWMDGGSVDAPDDLQARVVAILAAQSLRDPSELSAETTLESLGIDSLGLAEILFAVEETFDIEVPFNANTPDSAALDLRTVGSACAAVAALVRAQGG